MSGERKRAASCVGEAVDRSAVLGTTSDCPRCQMTESIDGRYADDGERRRWRGRHEGTRVVMADVLAARRPLAPELRQSDGAEELPLSESLFRLGLCAILAFSALTAAAPLILCGGQSRTALMAALAVVVTAVPVGVLLRPRGRSLRRDRLAVLWFIAYADLVLVSLFFSFQRPDQELTGMCLFGLVGVYVVHFGAPWLRIAHLVLSNCVPVISAVLCIVVDQRDPWTEGLRCMGALVVFNVMFALYVVYTRQVVRVVAVHRRRAATDPLTGIANRRAFELHARALLESEIHGVAIILVDIDRFKQINDAHGHQQGDRTLIAVGSALTTAVDSNAAIVARIGGDEFAIAVPVEELPKPFDAARICAGIEVHVRRFSGADISVGISRTAGPASSGPEALIDAMGAADMYMYLCKRLRRHPVWDIGSVPGRT